MNNSYRDVLKLCRSFYWADDKGREWSKVLKGVFVFFVCLFVFFFLTNFIIIASAQKEFRDCMHEKDPLVRARMVFVGRSCLEELRVKFESMEQAIKKRIEVTKETRKS